MKLEINIGDVIYTGKFKNKKTVVEKFGTDKYGQPTINDKTILKIRVDKWIPSKPKTETTIKLKDVIKF